MHNLPTLEQSMKTHHTLSDLALAAASHLPAAAA